MRAGRVVNSHGPRASNGDAADRRAGLQETGRLAGSHPPTATRGRVRPATCDGRRRRGPDRVSRRAHRAPNIPTQADAIRHRLGAASRPLS